MTPKVRRVKQNPPHPPNITNMALTHEDHVAGGHARQAKWRERKLEEQQLAESVTAIIEPLAREHIGPELLRMALKLAEAASTAQVEVSTPLERKQTAETAQILHKMGRLELGESTANTATFDVTARDAQVAALKQRVAELDAEDQGPTST